MAIFVWWKLLLLLKNQLCCELKKNQFFDQLQVMETSLFQISRLKFKGKSKLSEYRCNLKKHVLNFKSSSSILWHLKSNICAHVESRYFLFFKIFQELEKIFKISCAFFRCYNVLFIYKKSGTFNIFLTWSSQKKWFFLRKELFFLKW